MSDKYNWTEDKVRQLKQLYDSEIGWLEISKVMKCTPDQARMKYRNTWGETGAFLGKEAVEVEQPRIALFDVETLPLVGYAWGMYEQNIGMEEVISGTGLLSWAGKFLNGAEMYSDILTSKEAPQKNDKRITKSCWEFLSNCDIVVGHNLVGFDSKVVNTMFLKHDLPPLKYVQVDTLQVARNNFRFDSNKMGFINRALGIREKMSNEGFPLWKNCHNGDKQALKTMLEYNQNDVLALEDLYYKLRPYIRNINFALYNETDLSICPVCGSADLDDDGHYYTPAGKWKAVRCNDCNAPSRRKTNLLDKDKRKSLLINS